jgi:phosphatidylethanolamine/phosphatidyl-N-methylethanolamine N-methyltransferase
MKKEDILKVLSFDTFIPFFYPALMLPLRYYRKRAIEMLNFRPGDRVLIPGVGSGHDIPFLPEDVSVEGVDISDVMLGIGNIKLKFYKERKNVRLSVMDAENLKFPGESFDKAILSLFLTVVYDPKKAFSEVVRVMKPGGEILVYDHVFRKGEMPPGVAKPVDKVLSYSFASVTRIIDDIIEGQPVSIVKQIQGDPVGFVKGILLSKA